MQVLLLLLIFQAQPDLPSQNQLQIQLMENRMRDMERQLDRVENTVDEVKRLVGSPNNTDVLIYLLMALIGIDKGSYYIRRRNGRINGNSKGGKGL